MMDPTSTNNKLPEQQPPLPSRPSQQSPPYTLSLDQQQALALRWLEQQHQQEQQQQQQQQQRHSLNQAILVAAAAAQQQNQQQQQQQPPQSVILPGIGSTSSPLTSTNARNHQHLLEMELRCQIILQQQLLQTTPVESVPLVNSESLLQERLSQLLPSTNRTTNREQNGVIPNATSGSTINTISGSSSDVDRVMAAETLLQRNRLQDAIRLLQIQGMLQADNSQSRVVNGNHNTNPLAASARLIPNDPITPHTIGQAAITNSSISQLLQPGILLVGQQLESKVPQMTPLIDDPYQNTTSKSLKRKSESSTQHSTSTKETQPKKLKSKETKIGNLSSFPLPSMKRARRLTMSFKSFQDVWDELETIPLQKEIFIRRLYKYDYKLLD